MFVPLQVLSSYSLLQSTNQLEPLVKTAAQRGYQALALTDRNVMYGTVAFYQLCQKYHVQPLIGLTLTLAGQFATDQSFELVLLAKNQTGYQHLMAISSFTQTQSDNQPVELAQVQQWLSDLVVIVPNHSELQFWLTQGQRASVMQLLDQYKSAVDPDSLMLGMATTLSETLRQMMTKLAADARVKVVALPEVHYLDPSDQFAVNVLTAIKTGRQSVTFQKLDKNRASFGYVQLPNLINYMKIWDSHKLLNKRR